MKTAIVFAGQGAQTPGMGKELYDAYPAARQVFAEATAALTRVTGGDKTMEDICFSMPAEELNLTANSQPAIFTLSMAGLAVIREELPELAISAAAGFSLGECSALCGAGVLDFDSAMELILLRGEAMAKACGMTDGAMYAIIGIGADVCEQVCDEMRGDGVLMAVNYNCPGQTVIAGDGALAEAAAAKFKELGAMKAVKLSTQGAFHTPLMNAGRDIFVPAIEKFEFKTPEIKLWSDVTGAPIDDITPDYLGRQMTSPVRWQTIIEGMLADGVELFVELGPGRVLSGLIRRISRTAKLVNIESPDSIEKLKELTRE
ncbi:MAG: ACP S-malonyltransferase [Ruminococcaceae bacterium]|nr:ACP S-malonyltransferase [Oscillospiraceae bacterium]